MHATRNDLPQAQREKLTELLNVYLAGLIDLQRHYKQAHWNVRGPNFIALHQLFEKLGDDLGEFIDETAERATSLGGIADGTLAGVSKRTRLPASNLQLISGREHLESLAAAVAVLAQGVRGAIEEANSHSDAVTADLFTEICRNLDLQLWLLEAHLAP